MTETNLAQGYPGDKPTLPSGINVLTILTIIGCAVFFLFTIYGYVNAKKGIEQMENTINSKDYDSMPAMVKKMVNADTLALAQKQYDNRVPINLIGVISLVLCLVGALQMRKLKMQGYYLYLIGELLPLLATVIFVGVGALTGFTGIITIVFMLLFILLYTLQRKYLVN
jgi:hypothetical protein